MGSRALSRTTAAFLVTPGVGKLVLALALLGDLTGSQVVENKYFDKEFL